MAQEYRLEEVLISIEGDNVLSALTEQRGTLESFDHYNSNPNEIIDEIAKSDEEKRKKYIKGLISIYPLSSGILEALMDKYDLQSMREDIFAWLDISDTLSSMVNKFITVCSDGIKTGEKSEFEDQIELLEKKKKSLEELRIKHEENRKKLASKRQEVDDIKAECEELERKYSPEILKKEEERYTKERAKLRYQKKEFESKLEKLENEMKPYRNIGNKEFDKAMEAFSKVISTLPHDEG